MAIKRGLSPFPITAEDAEGQKPRKKRKVTVVKSKPRFQALSEDMIWVLEQDISRMKTELSLRDGPMTERERNGFVKVSEQLRKLRWTDAELSKLHDPGKLDDEALAEELVDRLLEHNIPQAAIEVTLEVLGFSNAED